MKRPSKGLALAAAGSVLLSGCAVSGPSVAPDGTVMTSREQACKYDYAASAVTGALIGGLLGAALGGNRNRAGNVAMGAVGGGAVALLLTSYLEKRCKALDAARAQMRAAQLDYGTVTLAPAATMRGRGEEGLHVTATDPAMFAEGSAQLSPQGQHDMQVLAGSFAGSDRRILIVGHSDATGSAEANQALSEQRARTVAQLFAGAGIPAARLYFKGAGETRPVDRNDTAEGRARNRRVEVLELQSETGILAFDDAQDADPALLARNAATNVPPSAPAAAPMARPAKPAPRVVAKEKPVTPPAPGLRQARVDLGGVAVDGHGAPLAAYVGAGDQPKSALAFIPAAFASEPANAALLDTACIADSFKSRGAVKSLATGQAVRVSDHAKGLFGKSWTATVNGNLVGLTNVSVLRGGVVDAAPELMVFTGYKPGDQKPSFSAQGEAQAYIGAKGTLYRVFYRDMAQPVRCMDIVFSRAAVLTTYGRIYYQKDGRTFAAVFQPATKAN